MPTSSHKDLGREIYFYLHKYIAYLTEKYYPKLSQAHTSKIINPCPATIVYVQNKTPLILMKHFVNYFQ